MKSGLLANFKFLSSRVPKVVAFERQATINSFATVARDKERNKYNEKSYNWEDHEVSHQEHYYTHDDDDEKGYNCIHVTDDIIITTIANRRLRWCYIIGDTVKSNQCILKGAMITTLRLSDLH